MTKITIAIPNRNNDKYLEEAIQSVLNQKDRDFAFFISDNCSTDQSLEIINKYNNPSIVVFKTNKDLTYHEHLLFLLDKVKTDYVIFLAGDDLILPELIFEYNNYLQNHIKINETYGFICSKYHLIDKRGVFIGKSLSRLDFNGINKSVNRNFLKQPIVNISSVAWNVSKMKNIFIPVTVGNCIDWYLYIALSRNNNILFIDKYLLKYRIHDESTGNSNVIAHTKNCMSMFYYVLNNFNYYDQIDIDIINKNLREFERVISGSLLYKIKNLIKIFIRRLQSKLE